MNSFQTLTSFEHGGKRFRIHSLPALAKNAGLDLSAWPYSHRVLLENLLRQEDGLAVRRSDIEAVLALKPDQTADVEIQFTPARVLLQDFTGVPVIADLAALRAAWVKRGGQPEDINPLQPVDLVIDHSVQMDFFGEKDAARKNLEMEFQRNGERYAFLKWGQTAFRNLQVVPPGAGICHQVNLEFLSHLVMSREQDGETYLYPDTLVGTDSHTTMINGLGVLGWGVGGIEAEAAMLGQPCTMLFPAVTGVELTGQLPPGATATDLVLRLTELLRKKDVVGRFVEYFGPGVAGLSVADRATVSNMSPEYGATVGLFPPDARSVEYMKLTGRTERAERAEAYLRAQEMWNLAQDPRLKYGDILKLDLSTVEPAMAGPARPQDRVPLAKVRSSFREFLLHRSHESLREHDQQKLKAWTEMSDSMKSISFETSKFHPDADLGPLGDPLHGSIAIAAITSCTNTSNPELMVGAGLLARNAARRGLKPKPWVKTTFSPGSVVVSDYLTKAGLMPSLEALGFHVAGYGCATCIGNSGPLRPEVQKAVDERGVATVAVLSGNRNFEARIHPSVMANYLASPPLVVAAALAGNINVNLAKDSLGHDADGKDVYLKDIWPDPAETAELVRRHLTPAGFDEVYKNVFRGDAHWRSASATGGPVFDWPEKSTYIKQPPFLELGETPQKDVTGARILAIFGDSITTDHISPAGGIGKTTPAAEYLQAQGVAPADFNSYGSRRGNHEVMVRGTFANVRLRNRMVTREGGFTKIQPEGREATIFAASEHYRAQRTPLVIFAGREYGSGSSRDWAAKGPRLLGVVAVVAESFERIHRSNLVGMGILPLQLPAGVTTESLGLTGAEEISLQGLSGLQPKGTVQVVIRSADGTGRTINTTVRVDTPNELLYEKAGGILPFMMNSL